MSSCAVSSCTCFPKASFAFATSASWQTADAPRCCHYVSHYLAQFHRRSNQKPLSSGNRILFGAAPSAANRWPSSNDRCLQHLYLAPFNFHKTRVSRASGFLLTAFRTRAPTLCSAPLCSPRARLRKSTSVIRDQSRRAQTVSRRLLSILTVVGGGPMAVNSNCSQDCA